jgi:hypothetical protein
MNYNDGFMNYYDYGHSSHINRYPTRYPRYPIETQSFDVPKTTMEPFEERAIDELRQVAVKTLQTWEEESWWKIGGGIHDIMNSVELVCKDVTLSLYIEHRTLFTTIVKQDANRVFHSQRTRSGTIKKSRNIIGAFFRMYPGSDIVGFSVCSKSPRECNCHYNRTQRINVCPICHCHCASCNFTIEVSRIVTEMRYNPQNPLVQSAIQNMDDI